MANIRRFQNNQIYPGRASAYLGMKFNHPTVNCLYVKMLQFIQKHPKVTRSDVFNGLGYKPIITKYYLSSGKIAAKAQYKNHELFQAMVENDLIVNVNNKHKHKYIITAKGSELILPFVIENIIKDLKK